jgi:hypothetical protein
MRTAMRAAEKVGKRGTGTKRKQEAVKAVAVTRYKTQDASGSGGGGGGRCYMAGLDLSDQKSTARRDHAHRDRRGLFSIHTKYGLLNRLPTKVSF